MREQSEGVTLIAVYHLVLAFVLLCAGLAILPAAFGALQEAVSPREAFGLGSSLFFSFLLTWGGTILSVPVAWGLLRRKEWARWGAILLAIVGIFALYPVLIILYLRQENVKRAFEPGL
ncbi:MAG: hypothetical protein IT330_18035 [Anaerolineae bacterium]|nr:hypothetical protein [Anaerolineae bacterium]